MKVRIDQSGCIGCGICADTCPEVFGMDAGGLAEVIAQPGDGSADSVREAAEGCPVSVIIIEE